MNLIPIIFSELVVFTPFLVELLLLSDLPLVKILFQVLPSLSFLLLKVDLLLFVEVLTDGILMDKLSSLTDACVLLALLVSVVVDPLDNLVDERVFGLLESHKPMLLQYLFLYGQRPV